MAETSTLPDYPTGLTFEKVWAMFQETDRKFQETDRKFQETDRKFQETERLVKETSQQMKETDRKFQETERLVKETSKQMGGLNNSFGELAQHLVAPNIIEKFNELDFDFTKCSLNVKIKEPGNKKKNLAEVDIMLEDGDVVVIVEVKARADKGDLEDHVIRMEKLRQYADIRGDKRRYQGAMAVAITDDSLRELILGQGFYLVEQTGDTVRINIPDGFSPKNW